LFLREAFDIHFDQGSVHEKTESEFKKARQVPQNYKKKDSNQVTSRE
jgi:hypothetical protein